MINNFQPIVRVRPATPDWRDRRIAELEAQLQQAKAENAALKEQIAQLQRQIAELERSGKRQATPFSRRKRKADPKRPGRKAGRGRFSFRAKPKTEEVDETKEEPLCSCPDCGGPLADMNEHEQFEIDIPKVRPKITRYVTHSGYCSQCRRRVRSRHPEQISEATGAAGVLIGPRAKALGADLKHRLGVPYAKISELMQVAFGLDFTRSGACQADARLAQQARPVYEELIELISQSAIVHADETGWRIGTLSAWLWVFTNRQITVYTVEESRGHEVVVEILGQEFAGILSSDCFAAYDHQSLANWLKQKCLGHILNELSRMEEAKSRGAVRFAQDVIAVLRAALALRAQKPKLLPVDFAAEAVKIEARLDKLIDEKRRLMDPDNARLAKRLRKQRAHLLRFLYVDGLDATNNQAERMLRPAVITRKTSGCNRTKDGAETHSILASVLVTCRQQALPILDFLVKVQRAVGGVMPSLAPLPQIDTS